MLDDKYIGVALAVCGSGLIGSSYVITKIGLRDATKRHGFKGDGFEYIKNPLWWTGMVMLVIGELFNFAAYAFAPAVLVTPLGALSVLTGTILGAYFLKERLGTLGKLGCALCIVSSVLIVANAPPDKDIQTVDGILDYALKPGKILRASLQDGRANTVKVYTIRFHHCSLFRCHDILSLPPMRHNESSILSVDLRCNGSNLSHGIEGLWNCSQIDLRWGKPIRTSINTHLCHRCNPLHHHTDELLQQGTEYLPSISVSTIPVRPTLPNIN